ncbi:MAG: glycosyltransferase [Micrococcaceae bacterium]
MMKSSTILIAADTYYPTINGASRFIYGLAHGLAERGHDVHIVCPDTTGEGQRVEHEGNVTLHRIWSVPSMLYGDFRVVIPGTASKQIKRIVDEIKPSVIHIQCHFSVGRAAAAIAKKEHIRLIGTNHTMPENILAHVPFLIGPSRNWVAGASWKDCGRIFKKCDVATAPTPRAANFLEKEGRVPTVWPISCGIDTSHYDAKEGEIIPKHEGKQILFVGRLDQEKNLDILIKAMQYIPSEDHAHLKIVGHGLEEEPLKKLVEELNLEDKVFFTGKISDEELRLAYLEADVFAMPGTAELQSLATLEAMCADNPIVAADAMALPHLIKKGKNGYLFEPNNIHDLAKKLHRVLSASDEERLAMGKVSKSMTYKHSLDATLDKFEKLYAGANSPEKS